MCTLVWLQPQFVHHLKDEVGQFAHAIGAVAPESSEIDVGEIVVCAAFLGRDSDLGRGRDGC